MGAARRRRLWVRGSPTLPSTNEAARGSTERGPGLLALYGLVLSSKTKDASVLLDANRINF